MIGVKKKKINQKSSVTVQGKEEKTHLKNNQIHNYEDKFVDKEEQELAYLNAVIDKANAKLDEEYGMRTMRLDNPEYTLEVGLASNIGRREYQQDVSIVSYENKNGDTKAIAILCDGMGGMSNGEIASNICVNQIFDDYRKQQKIENPNQFLIEEAQKADSYVSSLTDKDGEPLNSGCTLIAAIIDSKQLSWVSVGDSRIYVIRDDEMVQVTTDHNYMMILSEKVEQGEISMEEAISNPKKEALISYIGMCGLNLIDSNANPFELKSDDFVLMCSDGLYRTLSKEEMKYIIKNNYNNVSLAVQELVEAAVVNGSVNQDNTSAILIKCI